MTQAYMLYYCILIYNTKLFQINRLASGINQPTSEARPQTYESLKLSNVKGDINVEYASIEPSSYENVASKK